MANSFKTWSSNLSIKMVSVAKVFLSLIPMTPQEQYRDLMYWRHDEATHSEGCDSSSQIDITVSQRRETALDPSITSLPNEYVEWQCSKFA